MVLRYLCLVKRASWDMTAWIGVARDARHRASLVSMVCEPYVGLTARSATTWSLRAISMGSPLSTSLAAWR
jgi:hypothetical protein